MRDEIAEIDKIDEMAVKKTEGVLDVGIKLKKYVEYNHRLQIYG